MNIWIDPSAIKEKYIQKIVNTFPSEEISTDASDLKDAEVAVIMPGKVNEAFISQMPSLKMVNCLTAGYDRADLSVLKKRGISFTYAKDVFSIQIAEDVIAKILYFNRRLPDYHHAMLNHTWEYKPVSFELFGSTVGIIGAGSIGNEIAKRLKPFQCNMIGYRRSKVKDQHYDEMVYDQKGLEYLLHVSDYVIVSLPLTDKTKHFISYKEFSMMKKNCLIINVARGEIIDQEALIDALNNESIRGAALDVTSPEPLPSDHALWSLKNVFITPHQASSSPYINQRLTDEVIETLKRYIENEKLDNLVEL